jgi:hypothetical protein
MLETESVTLISCVSMVIVDSLCVSTLRLQPELLKEVATAVVGIQSPGVAPRVIDARIDYCTSRHI